LQAHGDAALRTFFERGVDEQAIGAEYIAHYLGTSIAIAYRAIQNGFDAFFTTAATLIDDLSAAFRAGELANAFQAASPRRTSHRLAL
jgi:hypothetical protein